MPNSIFRKRHEEEAWTFVETLIVIGLIMILTAAVGFSAFKYLDQAKVATAKSQIDTLSMALNAYYFDLGHYPSKEDGLQALWKKPTGESDSWKGPYLQKPVPKDPWGHPYDYSIPGPSDLPFGIRSFGSDGQEAGEGYAKDLSSWE